MKLFQLHFDLGTYFIFRQANTLARKHFAACHQLLQQCPNPSVFCKVPLAKLDGYRIACGVYSPPAQSSLLCQFYASISQQYMVREERKTFLVKFRFSLVSRYSHVLHKLTISILTVILIVFELH